MHKRQGGNIMQKIPEILVACSGEKIRTEKEWELYRRPEILALFSEFVYGKIPFGNLPPVHFSVLGEERTREGYRIRTVKACMGDLEFPFWLCLPENASAWAPMPAVLYLMFSWDREKEVPIKGIIKQGWAVCCFPVNGVASDSPLAFKTGVFQIAPPADAYAWGAISAWAWAAGRGMDYLETVPELKKDQIAIAGHSRGGKTALWAFALDPRFAVCLALNSGCAGASMSRNKPADGESIKAITSNLGYWFAGAFSRFADREELLAVDQHMLLALAAPRPVYITGATGDAWSDPDGELLSCRLAGCVYSLYGKKGLIADDEPQPDMSYPDGTIGYHRRTGGHGYTWEDWEKFFAFVQKKL